MNHIPQKLSHILKTPLDSDFTDFISMRFATNMEFFKTYNPNLFNALSLPPTDFNLYFKDNELNIINLKTKDFIYPKKEMINTAFNLAQNPLNNPRYKLYTNHLGLSKMDEQKLGDTAKACNLMTELLFSTFSPTKQFHLPSRFLPNLTIFGILDGIFLEILLDEGYFFHSLFIFEGEIDFFRIALYFVDFVKLFERVSPNACYIFVKEITDANLISRFFANKKITNNFLRLELKLYDSDKNDNAMSFIQKSYAINSRGWGSFEDEMIGVKNTFTNIDFAKSKHLPYKILNLPHRINAPICVVGNGASLDALLPFIKDNAKNMIIFSCGTAIRPLLAYGIRVDFQIEIERLEYLADILKQSDLSDITLLCGNMINKDVLALSKESLLFMRGGGASAYSFGSKSVVEFSSPFVGNAGVALASLLSEEVILCGLDCGYIVGKSKHASNSFYTEEKAEIPSNAFKVESNSTTEVYSDALFATSAKNISLALKIFAPSLALNLGYGAKIESAKPTSVEDFTLREISKDKEIKKIKSYFSDEPNAVFKDIREDLYLEEILSYKNEILKILKCEVDSKIELFKMLDNLNIHLAKKSSSSKFVGILYEGSVSHMMHYLMICSLHIPSDHIKDFYAKSVEIIERSLENMSMKYRLFTHAAR